MLPDCERNRNGGDRAGVKLALRTDVEQICLVGEREGERGKYQRRGLDQDLTKRIPVGEDLPQRFCTHGERIDLHKQQHAATDDQPDQHSANVVCEHLQLVFHACAPSCSSEIPAISRPICAALRLPFS